MLLGLILERISIASPILVRSARRLLHQVVEKIPHPMRSVFYTSAVRINIRSVASQVELNCSLSIKLISLRPQQMMRKAMYCCNHSQQEESYFRACDGNPQRLVSHAQSV